ncbi:MAG: hypothetical protein HQ517_11655 [SAR324 cluster bacterium]|nr:hypothetical protein [SAR324 cluster bacterium]
MRKVQKSILITTLITGFLISGFIFNVSAWSPWGKKDTGDESSRKVNGIFGVKKQSGGNVTVDLTPLSFEDGKLIIKVSISTHSVDDLNKYNLKEITQLEIGSNTIKPVKTPSLSGHHNSGKMVFEVAELPDKFAIGITGLDSPEKREFLWP